MIPLAVAEVAAVLGADRRGEGDAAALVTAVTADSRQVGPGALFVALAGERVDGHDYVGRAFAQGAVAALVAHPVDVASAGLQLVVADPLAAFGRLARHVVDRRHGDGLRVVGVTGSSGKTSTKDLLAAVLGAAGDTVAPAGNLNNELGVPLTVCRVGPGTRFLVAEMGARGIGHIRYLCSIAPPDVGVVLNVGQAHVGEFGGRAAIAQAKGELVEALPPTGTAVLNADDPLVWAMRGRTRAQVLPFAMGADPGGDEAVWSADAVGDERGRYTFVLHARIGRLYQAEPVRLLGTGRHQVANATAAAAAALALGLDVTRVAAALGTAERASRWRMEVTDRADGVTVLNDAYNANPDSMRAAVETLTEIARRRRPGRAWAVLGDMLELGDEAPAAHLELGRQVAAAGVDELVALGAYATTLAGAAEGVPARVAASKEEALRWLRAEVAAGDVVLVKGSRGLALETLAEDFLAAPVPSPDGAAEQDPGANPDRRKD